MRVPGTACTALLCALIVFLVSPPPASGQGQRPSCAPRADVLPLWAERYGEAPIARGLTDDGPLLEIWASADGAGWTAFVTRPDGNTCVVASGEGWQAVPFHLPVAERPL